VHALDKIGDEHMHTKRTVVTAGELYVLLDREFRLRQSRQCNTCYIMLPYRVDQQEEARSNWELIVPRGCSHGCAELVEELVEEYSRQYELAPEPGTTRG
jgi:hypothetical protein